MESKNKRFTQQSFGAHNAEFKDYWKKTGRKFHGGVRAKGKRKTARPFDSKKALHLVMRAENAKGPLSMLAPKNKDLVESTIQKFAAKNLVKIYHFSNNGNHLHLVVKARQRLGLTRFLRTICGLIPRIVTKAKRGKAKGPFWDALVFTRICNWGREYKNLKLYVIRNIMEAAGIIPYARDKFKFVSIEAVESG